MLATFPANETERLAALRKLGVLDSPDEQRFDRITKLAAEHFFVPISLISLVDNDRQWFKSCVGLGARQTPRDVSFCAHAILQDDILLVPDALEAQRFRDSPLVKGAPYIRFYAGMPLQIRPSIAVGTLCLIDTKPRPDLDLKALAPLRNYAAMVVDQLEMTRLRQEHARLEGCFRQTTALMDFVNASPWGFLRMRLDGQVLSANPAGASLLGVPYIDDSIDCRLDRLDPQFAQFQERMAAKGEVRGWRTKWQPASGEPVAVRLDARVVRDGRGQELFYDLIVRPAPTGRRSGLARLAARLLQG